MSQLFEVHPENPQPRLLKQAVQLLERGGVLAVPTDSSYALVCHLDDKAAADKLRRIREQPFLNQPASAQHASGANARQLLAELETLIQQQLLSAEPQISAEEYFQRASQALEKVVVIVDDCLDAYEAALRRTA